MKIGLFGGTFNPIHIGHLIIADYILHEFNLDLIYFIPAYQTTYKDFKNNAGHRKKMIELAIKDNDCFLLNDIELENKRISYTYETVKKLYNKKDRLFLILGDEWLSGFNKWHNYKEIFKYAELIIANRNNKNLKPPRGLIQYKPKIFFSKNPVIAIGSTMIRERISRGQDIRYLVPQKGYKYIKKHKLYIIL